MAAQGSRGSRGENRPEPSGSGISFLQPRPPARQPTRRLCCWGAVGCRGLLSPTGAGGTCTGIAHPRVPRGPTRAQLPLPGLPPQGRQHQFMARVLPGGHQEMGLSPGLEPGQRRQRAAGGGKRGRNAGGLAVLIRPGEPGRGHGGEHLICQRIHPHALEGGSAQPPSHASPARRQSAARVFVLAAGGP